MRRSTAAFAAVLATVLATVLAVVPAAAQPAEGPAPTTPLRESELPEANFAFAHRLGTGIYEISGRTVQVYSLPFERRLRERDDERAGLVLTLPVTLGFFDFKVQDILESGLPSDLSTLSFVPGLRWEIGITLGTAEPLRIAGVTLPRIGLGYRFGEDLSVFRLVIGERF